MKHVTDITEYLKILLQSERFHVLVVKGTAGWAKTTTIRVVLGELGIKYTLLGAYSTPLALFNTLHEVNTSDSDVLVLDDVAGVFGNSQALSLLNAASWPSAEYNATRWVQWTSTTEKSVVEGFDFRKKLVVLTNYMPQLPQAKAFINRSMHYEIELNQSLVDELLHQAAQSQKYFSDTLRATEVADFLTQQARLLEPGRISLRNLEMGYEFATINPTGWRELLSKVLPKAAVAPSTPEQIVLQLNESFLKTEEQAARFSQLTGKSRRTFFDLKKKLGMTTQRRSSTSNVVPLKSKAKQKETLSS